MYIGTNIIVEFSFSSFRSGKIPKAFKVIAQFRNWEQLLYLTQPDQWSAAAMYQVRYQYLPNSLIYRHPLFFLLYRFVCQCRFELNLQLFSCRKTSQMKFQLEN